MPRLLGMFVVILFCLGCDGEPPSGNPAPRPNGQKAPVPGTSPRSAVENDDTEPDPGEMRGDGPQPAPGGQTVKWTVLDAVTGKSLDTFRFGTWSGDGSVMTKGRGPNVILPPEPWSDVRLVLWAPGFELNEEQLSSLHPGVTPSTRLMPAVGKTKILPTTTDVRAEVRHEYWVGSSKRSRLIAHTEALGSIPEVGLQVLVSERMRARAYFERADRGFVWPVFLALEIGRTFTPAIDGPRWVQVQHLADKPEDQSGFGVPYRILDRDVDAGWPQAKEDALAWWHPATLLPRMRGAGRTLEIELMDAAYHLFMAGGEGGTYMHLGPADQVAVFRWSDRIRFASDGPRVAGKHLPTGSRIAVGRLDADIFRIVAGHDEMRRLFTLQVAADHRWETASLPAAGVLTCHVPGEGFAYLRPEQGQWVAKGMEPGSIVLEFPEGGTFSGSVALTRHWRALRSVRTGGEGSGYIEKVSGDSRVVVRGLPLGTYAVSVSGDLVGPNARKLSQGMSVTLTAAMPEARLRLGGD